LSRIPCAGVHRLRILQRLAHRLTGRGTGWVLTAGILSTRITAVDVLCPIHSAWMLREARILLLKLALLLLLQIKLTLAFGFLPRLLSRLFVLSTLLGSELVKALNHARLLRILLRLNLSWLWLSLRIKVQCRE
jgi:hypothetical protein